MRTLTDCCVEPNKQCPLREFFSLALPALRRIDDRDSEIYCCGTISMHVLRFFLTRPSVPMQGCAPARRRIRCAHLIETALFAACQLSRLRLPRSFQHYFHYSLPVSDLESPSQTDIQIP